MMMMILLDRLCDYRVYKTMSILQLIVQIIHCLSYFKLCIERTFAPIGTRDKFDLTHS